MEVQGKPLNRKYDQNAAYLVKHKDKVMCERGCGKAVDKDPAKRRAHFFKPPNNFLRCVDADGNN